MRDQHIAELSKQPMEPAFEQDDGGRHPGGRLDPCGEVATPVERYESSGCINRIVVILRRLEVFET